MIVRNGIDGKTVYQRFGVPWFSRLSGNLSGLAMKNLFLEVASPFLKKSINDNLMDIEKIEKDHDDSEIDPHKADMGPSCSGSNGELLFYLTDQRGQTMLSKIEPYDDGIQDFDPDSSSSTSSSAAVYVLVCWPDEILKHYDIQLLNSLPEVHRSGPSSLAPAREESISLYSCLEAFLKEEPLGPEDMW